MILESVAESLLTAAPAAAAGTAMGGPVGGIVGFAGGAGTIFGAEKYDQVVQDARKQGLIEKLSQHGIDGEQLVRDEAFKAALIEGGVEAGADLALGYVSRFIPGGSIAKEGVKDTIRQIFTTPLKQIGKNALKGAAIEGSTEALQSGWEASIEKDLGLQRENTAGELFDIDPTGEAMGAVVPAAGAGILFSLLGQGMGGVQKRNMIKRLYDAKANPQDRIQAAADTANILMEQHGNPLVVKNWFNTTAQKIQAGESVSVDELLSGYNYMIPKVPISSPGPAGQPTDVNMITGQATKQTLPTNMTALKDTVAAMRRDKGEPSRIVPVTGSVLPQTDFEAQDILNQQMQPLTPEIPEPAPDTLMEGDVLPREFTPAPPSQFKRTVDQARAKYGPAKPLQMAKPFEAPALEGEVLPPIRQRATDVLPEPIPIIEGEATVEDQELSRQIDRASYRAEMPKSEAQSKAGNYSKGHINLHGLDIAIENPRGSIRYGKDKKGNPWSQEMRSHYGYIKGTKGKDKDHIDAFVGQHPTSQTVYIVDQVDPDTGRLDEAKVLIGFPSLEAAFKGYMENYQNGWNGLGALTPTTMQDFKDWLRNGNKQKSFAGSAWGKRAQNNAMLDESLSDRGGLNSKLTSDGLQTLPSNVELGSSINVPTQTASQIPSIDASPRENFKDGGRSDTKLLGDSIKRQPLLPESNRILNSPLSRSAVSPSMLNLGQNFQVVGGVIQSVPVNVMDMLGSKKGAAKDALHDDSMLKALPAPIDSDKSIGSVVVGEPPNVSTHIRPSSSFHEAIVSEKANKIQKKEKVSPTSAVPEGLQSEPEKLSKEEGQVGKEPWEMGNEAYLTKLRDSKDSRYASLSEIAQQGFASAVKQAHERAVKKALSEGKPVPAEVLAEYPDLQKPDLSQNTGKGEKGARKEAEPVSPFVETAPASETTWPQPNAHGVYDKGLAEKEEYKGEKATAQIYVLQIGPDAWINSPNYHHKSGSYDGMGSPLSKGPNDETFKTREDALKDAAAVIAIRNSALSERTDSADIMKAEARNIMIWAAKLAGIEAKDTFTKEGKKSETSVAKDSFSPGSTVRIGKSPEVHTIVRQLEPTASEKELGELYFEVKDSKGAVATYEKKDLKPVKVADKKTEAVESPAKSRTIHALIESGEKEITRKEISNLYEIKQKQLYKGHIMTPGDVIRDYLKPNGIKVVAKKTEKPKEKEAELPEKKLPGPSEIRIRKMVENQKVTFNGIQEDSEGNPDLVMFTDPNTGSTLAVPYKGITVQKIKERIKESREEFTKKGKPEEKAGEPEFPDKQFGPYGWDTTPSTMINDYYGSVGEVEKVQDGNAKKIAGLKEQLKKLPKTKDGRAEKKRISEEIENIESAVRAQFQILEDRFMTAQEKIIDEAAERAKKDGVPEDIIDEFYEDFGQNISDIRPYVEYNYNRTIEEIYKEVVAGHIPEKALSEKEGAETVTEPSTEAAPAVAKQGGITPSTAEPDTAQTLEKETHLPMEVEGDRGAPGKAQAAEPARPAKLSDTQISSVAVRQQEESPKDVIKDAVEAAPGTTAKELKQQKKFLIEHIDEAIKEAPEEIDGFYRKVRQINELKNQSEQAYKKASEFRTYEKKDESKVQQFLAEYESLNKQARDVQATIPSVTIEVPNDGNFTVYNNKGTLKKFKEIVNKQFTTTVEKAKNLTQPSGKARGYRAPSKLEEGLAIKIDGKPAYTDGSILLYGESKTIPDIPAKRWSEDGDKKHLAERREKIAKSSKDLFAHNKKGATLPVDKIKFVAIEERPYASTNKEENISYGVADYPIHGEKQSTTILMSGDVSVAISTDYYQHIMDHYPDATFKIGVEMSKEDNIASIGIYSKGKHVGIVMPWRATDAVRIAREHLNEESASGETESVKAPVQEEMKPEETEIETAAPGESKPEEPAKSLQDFGTKIGGARKDIAERGYTKIGKKKASESEGPAWKQRFVTAEKTDGSGRYTIIDTKEGRWSFSSGGQTFATKEEAEQAIPIYAVAKSHHIYENSDKIWSIYKRVGERKRFKVVSEDFASREDAMNYMAQNAEKILNTKTTFGEEILPVPDIAKRTGVERRKVPATPEMFIETFAPRGIEFGNWQNQEERQMVMNHAYDGLMDLAEVLNVPPKALMLNGELAIAFGARGQGLTGAKAHYERDYGVINLTKMKGAGSLAHEWMHAFDHYLGRLDTKAPSEKITNKRGDLVYKTSGTDDLLSQGISYKSKLRPEIQEAYKALIETMYKKAEKYIEDTKQADKFVATSREHLKESLDGIRKNLESDLVKTYTWRKNKKGLAPASAEQLAEFDKLANILVEGGNLETRFEYGKPDDTSATVRGAFSGRRTNETLEAMNAILKAVRNRSGFNKENDGSLDRVRANMGLYAARLKMLEDAKGQTEKTKQVPTSFAMEAKKMDQARTGDYWSEPHEMVARAFASYVEDKVAEKGGQSDFLVYHAHGGILIPMIDGFVARPYPGGKEREATNAAFDKFINTLKTKETDNGIALYSSKDAGTISRMLDKFGQNVRIPSFINMLREGVKSATITAESADRITSELRKINEVKVSKSELQDIIERVSRETRTEKSSQVDSENAFERQESAARAKALLDDLTPSERESFEILSRDLRQTVAPAEHLTATQREVAERWKTLTGTRIIFAKHTGKFDGASPRKGVIVLSDALDTSQILSKTIAHELFHNMERVAEVAPSLRPYTDRFSDIMRQVIGEGKIREFFEVENKKRINQLDMNPLKDLDEAWSEHGAHIMGDAMRDQRFYERLYAKDQNLFERLVQAVLAYFRKLGIVGKEAVASDYYTPAQAVRLINESADLFAKYLEVKDDFNVVTGEGERGTKYSSTGPAPAFYSQLERTVTQSLPESVKPEGLLAFLKGFKFKQDDLIHSGIAQVDEKGNISLDPEVTAMEKNGRIAKSDLMALIGEKSAKIVPVEFKSEFINAPTKEEQDAARKELNKLWMIPANNRTEEQIARVQELGRMVGPNSTYLRTGEQAGATHFSNWKIPGESIPGSYVEHFETVPGKTNQSFAEEEAKLQKEFKNYYEWATYKYGQDRDLLGTDYIDNMRKLKNLYGDKFESTYKDFLRATVELERQRKIGQPWVDGHPPYDEVKNPIVRWRGDGRIDTEGNKVFFIHEIQAPSKENQAKMPKWAQKRWREIGLKSALRYAAENGYSKLALATGEQVAGLYDLSKQVESIKYDIAPKGEYRDQYALSVKKKGEDSYTGIGVFPKEKLADVVGKDVAEKIISGQGEPYFEKDTALSHAFNNPEIRRMTEEYTGKKIDSVARVLSGIDLNVGGEGIKKLYDKDLPSILSDMGKRFGVKIGESQIESNKNVNIINQDGDIVAGFASRVLAQQAIDEGRYAGEKVSIDENTDTTPITSLFITPAMRDSVLTEGQSLYAAQGSAGRGISYIDALFELKKLELDFENLQNFVVVESENELPKTILKDMARSMSKGDFRSVEGVYDGQSKTSYLISRNIASRTRLQEVVKHELVHKGIRTVIGTKVEPIFNAIAKKYAKDIEIIAQENKWNLDKTADRMNAVDEFIAQKGEQYKDQPLIKRLIAQVRAFLREMGFTITWSDNDILNLAGAALKAEGMGDEIKYSFAGKSARGWDKAGGKFSDLADRQERFEISDEGAKLKNIRLNDAGVAHEATTLREILDHPALFKAYPKLKNLDVLIYINPTLERASGGFQSFEDRSSEGLTNIQPEIKVNAPDEGTARKTLLHEVQHFIQENEGFARGGNMQMFGEDATWGGSYAQAKAARVLLAIKDLEREMRLAAWGKSWDREKGEWVDDAKKMKGKRPAAELIFKDETDKYRKEFWTETEANNEVYRLNQIL
ncbi:hypothetical protein C4544_02240, partial [candidate division WS5 bacterium]